MWFWGFGVVQLPNLATLVLSGSGHSETIVLVLTHGFHSYMHKQLLVWWNKSKSKSSVDPTHIVLVARLEPVMQIQLLLGDPTTKGSIANLHFSGLYMFKWMICNFILICPLLTLFLVRCRTNIWSRRPKFCSPSSCISADPDPTHQLEEQSRRKFLWPEKSSCWLIISN